MAISFVCPQCDVQIEVGDEFAGHAGQCPRCQNVIAIPWPMQPESATTVSVSPVDPWEEPSVDVELSQQDPEPAEPSASKPAAVPVWAWVIGVVGVFVLWMLLFSSFLVLVFWRRTEPPRPVPLVEIDPPVINVNGVTAGRLDGQQAFMKDGVFQTRLELDQNDPLDRFTNAPCKRFDIQLLAGRDYVIEMEGRQSNCNLRLETVNGPARNVFGNQGFRVATLGYRPQFNENCTIHASSANRQLGSFTLTIRERNVPKPIVP
jgi:hypothetical protein